MDETFLIGMAVKMAAAALVVIIAAKVVERVDAFFGAMIATLPLSAGPSYVFLAMEHGAAFVSRSALVSLGVFLATTVFIIVYSHMAQRFGAVLSTLAGLSGWMVTALIMSEVSPSLPAAIAANASAMLVALVLTRPLVVPGRPKPRVVPRWWDIPFRATVVMTLVATVLTAARIAGPTAAGIGALMPMVFASLTLILHPRLGGPSTAEVMIASIVGNFGIVCGLAVVHLAVVPLGTTIGLSLGLAACVMWNSMLIIVRQARTSRSAST